VKRASPSPTCRPMRPDNRWTCTGQSWARGPCRPAGAPRINTPSACQGRKRHTPPGCLPRPRSGAPWPWGRSRSAGPVWVKLGEPPASSGSACPGQRRFAGCLPPAAMENG